MHDLQLADGVVPTAAPLEGEEPRRLRPSLRAWRGPLLQFGAIIGFGVLIVLVWQAIHWMHLVSEFVLPTPAETARALGSTLANFFEGGYVLQAALTTAMEVGLGFGAAAVVGISMGVLAGDTTFGRTVLMPYMVAVNAMPKIAFAPVFVAWLGFGTSPKILLAAFMSFFPIVVTTAAGIRAYSADELLLFRSMEASKWQMLVKWKFPTALPFVFAGLKTAGILSVIGAIVAEFLGGSGHGLGELIQLAGGRLEIDTVFALIMMLSVLGGALYGALVLIERRVVYWGPNR